MNTRTRKKIIAYGIFLGLFCLFLFLHFKTGNEIYLPFAIVVAGLWLLLFIMGKLIISKPLKELTMQQAQKQIAKHKNTSDWAKTKGIITRFVPLNRIVENGEVVAQLYYFYLQTEREAGVLRTDKAAVGGHIIPISHVGSFGINTPVNVLVNKTGAWAIFDPENEEWHYEVKK